MTLIETKRKENAWVRAMGGCWEIREWDRKQNSFSRALIRALKRENGRAFLGKINLCGEERGKYYSLREYTSGMVFNFEADFAVPVKDDKLGRLILERDMQPYTGVEDDSNLVNNILERVNEIKGVTLRWV